MTESRRAVMNVIFGEVRLAMDLWLGRPGRGTAAEEAAEILAAWAHAHRLAKIDDPVWPELDKLANSHSPALAEAAVAHDGPDAWLQDLDALRDKAVAASRDGEFEARAGDALDLFTRLDQAQLVAWSLLKLGPPGAEGVHARWLPCERAFRKNTLEFFPIANYAETLYAEYRPDLRAYDADLAAITAKYAVLLEAGAARDSDSESRGTM